MSSSASSAATPTSTTNPRPIDPVTRPSTVTDALDTRCTTARIPKL
jgi:hypothetical protein